MRTGIKSEDIKNLKNEADEAVACIDSAIQERKPLLKHSNTFMRIIGKAEDMQEELENIAEELKKPEQ
jgi:undecaprenyl pyrophosphate synthase